MEMSLLQNCTYNNNNNNNADIVYFLSKLNANAFMYLFIFLHHGNENL